MAAMGPIYWLMHDNVGKFLKKNNRLYLKKMQWIILLKYVETMEFCRGYDLGVLG